jgi:hypothetical protein
MVEGIRKEMEVKRRREKSEMRESRMLHPHGNSGNK